MSKILHMHSFPSNFPNVNEKNVNKENQKKNSY